MIVETLVACIAGFKGKGQAPLPFKQLFKDKPWERPLSPSAGI